MQTRSIKIPQTWESGTHPVQTATYTHDMRGRVMDTTRSTGELGTSARTTYDPAGRIATQTDEAGLTTTYSYSIDGLTTTITIPTGATLVTRRHTDGSLLEESGSGQQARYYSYHLTTQGLMTRVRLDTPQSGPVISEVVFDALRRTRIVRVPGGDGTLVETRHSYDARGRLIKIESDGRPSRLYEYDAMGNLTREIEKLSTGSTPNPSVDRIVSYTYGRRGGSAAGSPLLDEWIDQNTGHMNESERNRLKNSLTFAATTKTWHYYGGGYGQNVSETTLELVSSTRRDLTDLNCRIDKNNYQTLECTLVSGPVATRCRYADSLAVAEYAASAEGEALCSTNSAGGRTTYQLSRQSTGSTLQTTDPRNNTTTTQYDRAGRELSVTDAKGITLVVNQYSPVTGLLLKQTDANGAAISYNYDIRGRKIAEYGTGTYPVRYQYDAADRLTGMETYRVPGIDLANDPSGRTDGDSTSWTYNNATGLLTGKTYADGTRQTCTYDKLGRLLTQTEPSGRTSTCSYTFGCSAPTGITRRNPKTNENSTINRYYDQWERLKRNDKYASNEYLCHNLHYDSKGELDFEETTGDSPFYYGYRMNYRRSAKGHYLGYTLHNHEGEPMQSVALEYDALERIKSVTHDGQDRFTYGYEEGTGRQNTLTYPNGVVKTVTLENERNYPEHIVYARPGEEREHYRQELEHNDDGSIKYDMRRHRGTHTREHRYNYNLRGELTEHLIPWNEDRTWNYDNIGNRKQAQTGESASTYASNRLNQYTSLAGPSGTNTPAYDADGNRTQLSTLTGNWQVAYGAHGRASRYTQGNREVTQTYDASNRLIIERTTEQTGSLVHEQIRFYQGNLVIAIGEMDAELHVPVVQRTILWDPTQPSATRPLLYKNVSYPLATQPTTMIETTMMDTTCVEGTTIMDTTLMDTTMVPSSKTSRRRESPQAPDMAVYAARMEGGAEEPTTVYDETTCVENTDWEDSVMETTMMIIEEEPAPVGDRFYYLHDHNKNVIGLMDIAGNLQARYEYSAYGEELLHVGPLADENLIRFSSEWYNPVTGLVDYLYRSYNPVDGRWTQRDPIAEQGGINLYNFVGNKPVLMTDSLGMSPSRREIEDRTQIVRELLDRTKECYKTSRKKCCQCLYDDYLNMLANLIKDAGEFYKDLWWTSDSDQRAFQDVYTLPMSIEGVDISKEQLDTQFEAGEIAGEAMEDNIFNKYRDEIQNGADFAAGFSDGYLLGFGQDIAELVHGSNSPWADSNSGWYTGGEWAGIGVAAILGGRGAKSGVKWVREHKEIKIGKNFRIAPFGNAGKYPAHKYGKWPHYHIRGKYSPKHKGPKPGQSLKRHRPGEPSEFDKSIWDRLGFSFFGRK